MKKPNFFIIGAPKCGTTSMAAWLSEHPSIFMSPVKEPHYFNTDEEGGIDNIKSYEALFEGANDSHIAVGEASVMYLYSKIAIKNINSYNSESKFIVMVRNPIDMAPSLHEQFVYSQDEDEPVFEKAWDLQDERASGKMLPPSAKFPHRLQYGNYCKLGEKISVIQSVVGSDRILIVFLDELAKSPEHQYERVLKFIGVDQHDKTEFPVLNSAKEAKSRVVSKALTLAGRARLKLGFSRTKGFGILSAIRRLNRHERARSRVSPNMHHRLERYFHSDIQLLASITGRDLGHWLSRDG